MPSFEVAWSIVTTCFVVFLGVMLIDTWDIAGWAGRFIIGMLTVGMAAAAVGMWRDALKRKEYR
jgi:hypothetical protein